MKVREFIEALSRLPGDAQVFVADEVCNWTDEVTVTMAGNISVYDPIEETATDHQDVVVVF